VAKGWQQTDRLIEKKFNFSNYLAGVEFAIRVANIAEQVNHHPEIKIGFCWVEISTTTHDKGNTITNLDHKLVSEIDAMDVD
jgi:4a-hydroxytetrahydrobiopterin dehydratase